MTTSAIRKELRKYIDEADDRFVKMVYVMMKVSKEAPLLSEQEKQELTKRVTRHRNGQSKSYS